MSETTVRLRPGDVAPEFTLPDADGAPVNLSSYRGRRVILYFYPAAGTPGCVQEAREFQDNLGDLGIAGFAIVGISPDEQAVLQRFREDERLSFRLLSDPRKDVLRAYGAYGQKTVYGRPAVGVIRTTFVLDERTRITRVYHKVHAHGHVGQLRRDLGI